MRESDQDTHLTIRPLCVPDAQAFAAAFCAQGWDKPQEQFNRYLAQQEAGKREVFTAVWDGQVAGYVTLLPMAQSGPFRGTGYPEICDFNVLKCFQRRGIGSCLLDAAEASAAKRSAVVTLGVGLHSGYGAAQRMYVRRGYVFDGSGVWYRDEPLAPYTPCVNDDDLVLYMSKRLETSEHLGGGAGCRSGKHGGRT